MPKKRSRVFSRAFKLAAVRRMMAGEDRLLQSAGKGTSIRSIANTQTIRRPLTPVS